MDPLILIIAAVVVIVVVLAVVMMRGRKKDAPAGGATAQALDELPPDALPGAGAPSGATMVLSTVARAAAWLVLRKGGQHLRAPKGTGYHRQRIWQWRSHRPSVDQPHTRAD